MARNYQASIVLAMAVSIALVESQIWQNNQGNKGGQGQGARGSGRGDQHNNNGQHGAPFGAGNSSNNFCLMEKWMRSSMNKSSSSSSNSNSIPYDCSADPQQNFCLSLNDTGLRWYFDQLSSQCQPFLACKAPVNGNNFPDLDTCASSCNIVVSNSTKQELFGGCDGRGGFPGGPGGHQQGEHQGGHNEHNEQGEKNGSGKKGRK